MAILKFYYVVKKQVSALTAASISSKSTTKASEKDSSTEIKILPSTASQWNNTGDNIATSWHKLWRNDKKKQSKQELHGYLKNKTKALESCPYPQKPWEMW